MTKKCFQWTRTTYWEDCFEYITNRQYARLMTANRTVVLGSRLYCNASASLLNRIVEAPVSGLPIGKMLQALPLTVERFVNECDLNPIQNRISTPGKSITQGKG